MKEFAKHISLARVIGLRYPALRNIYPEDFYQIVAEAAWTAYVDKETPAVRVISSVFAHAMREYGYYKPEVDGVTSKGWKKVGSIIDGELEAKQYEVCCVKWCNHRGAHHSKKLGRICHRHYAVIQRRNKLGWRDPEYKIEFAGVPEEAPRRNNEFWRIVKRSVTPPQWAKMWLWAKGYNQELPIDALLRAHKAIFNQGE